MAFTIDARSMVATDLPAALADAHGSLSGRAAISLRLGSEWEQPQRAARRRFVLIGAGFGPGRVDVAGGISGGAVIRTRRRETLADTVDGAMRILVCGLNPSLVSARRGVGFVGATNRFWAAATSAGLVGRDRDPRDALRNHGVGMTDLVKRATARADEIAPHEYRRGAERVAALVEWLRPAAICFVGVTGYRVGVDPSVRVGWQPGGFGGAPCYVMPSTSGANAHASFGDLVDHFRVVRAAAGRVESRGVAAGGDG